MQIYLQTPVPELQRTISFYEKIGFKVVQFENAWYAIDQGLKILINEKRTARPGIVIYEADISKYSERWKQSGKFYENEDYMLTIAPSGVWVYFMKKEAPNLPLHEEKSVLGSLAGISLETINMKHSVDFWNDHGFEIAMGGLEQAWIALKHRSGLGMSFMKPDSCPHTFYNPSLSYFNSGNNLAVIAELRKREVAIFEEISIFNDQGVADNVILKDPGGIGFFIFND